MQLTTTISEIRKHNPCADGFAKIRNHFGVSPDEAKTHDKPFPVALLLEASGLDGTLWVAAHLNKRLVVLWAADCAERALPIFETKFPNGDRPRKALELARDPNATRGQLLAAAEAVAAAWAAAGSASAAGSAASAAWYASAAGSAGSAARAAVRAGSAAWYASAALASRDAAGDARGGAEVEQFARLKQYLEHGEAAADMLWPGDE